MAEQTNEFPQPGDALQCAGCFKVGYWDAYENGLQAPAGWCDVRAKWIVLTICPDCAQRWQAYRLVWVDDHGIPETYMNDLAGELVRAEDM